MKRATPRLMPSQFEPSEHDEQCAVFNWATQRTRIFPQLRLLYAIPNGGDRHAAVGAKMRAEGVKPGIPDLLLPVARGGYFGLYIEMKRRTKGAVTPLQREWGEALTGEGYQYRLCKGADQAINELLVYMHGAPTVSRLE